LREPSRRFASETAPQAGKNAASASRRQNAPRDHQGSRGLSQACAAFFVSDNGLLRIVSETNRRLGSGVV
jgi:hypothetical protein